MKSSIAVLEEFWSKPTACESEESLWIGVVFEVEKPHLLLHNVARAQDECDDDEEDKWCTNLSKLEYFRELRIKVLRGLNVPISRHIRLIHRWRNIRGHCTYTSPQYLHAFSVCYAHTVRTHSAFSIHVLIHRRCLTRHARTWSWEFICERDW